MSEIHDCVAAFADGEPVDPELLDRALADADGRAYLIDLLVLRGLYGRRAPLTMPDLPETPVRPSRVRWFPAAAAVVLVSVLGGYVAGRQSAGPPSVASNAGSLRPQMEIMVTAPAPTQVIRLEPGVDWSERGGRD